MRKKFIVFLSLQLVMLFVFGHTGSITAASSESLSEGGVSYTYFGRGEMDIPSLYKFGATAYFDGVISDICVYDGKIHAFIPSAGEIAVLDSGMNITWRIDLGGAFGDGGGLFVSETGIYVSDPAALCVYAFDTNGELVRRFFQPESTLYDTSIAFCARRVAADAAGNVYAIVDGLYQGAVMFSSAGEFLGFYGSNLVEMSFNMIIDQLWKSILSDEQAFAMQRFVPLQFTSFDIDSEGFFYTSSGDAALAGARVRKLNPSGASLWNGETMFFGDNDGGGVVSGLPNSSRIIDLDIGSDGFLRVIDAAKGKVFEYDAQGMVTGVFGGKGLQNMTFSTPSAIETLDGNIYVLDAGDNSISRFEETEFGKAVHSGNTLYQAGKYIESEPYWEYVLSYSPSYYPALVGLGKAAYERGDINAALDYLERSGDNEEYSLVFARYRVDFVRSNFTWVAISLAAAIALIVVLVKTKLFGFAGYFAPLKLHFRTIVRPSSGIDDLVYKKKLSPLFAISTVAVFLLVQIISQFSVGFIFNPMGGKNFLLLPTLVSTVGFYIFFCVANWSISTLSDGKGAFRSIFCVTAYALLPYIICQAAYIILSNVMTLDEGAFLTWIQGFGVIWSAFVLFVAIMYIHQFSIEKTAGNILLTVIGMAVVIFILAIVAILCEHVVGLIRIAYNEITLRR